MASASGLIKQILYPGKTPGKIFGIDFVADLYQGCSHGCLFCEFASLENDFGTVSHKMNAIDVLTKELTTKPAHAVISLGSGAAPYPGIEAARKFQPDLVVMDVRLVKLWPPSILRCWDVPSPRRTT